LDRIKDDVKRLSEKKKKGRNVGKLKFKSDVRSVPLKQYGKTYKILDYKYIKIQGVKQNIRVRGLKQILVRLGENIEVANADFINKQYQIVCYQDDNIKSWQKIWGRRILETSIGGIKSDIDKKIQTPVEIDRFFPSTKRCSECGHEREIGLDERIYECLNPKCQIKKDRDWNSSINIKIEGLRIRNIRIVDTGRIDFKPAEIGSSTLDMEYFNRIPYVKASSVKETGSLTALA
jgi:transposase